MVTRRAGLTGLRIHDLRHNFASFGAVAEWACLSSANCSDTSTQPRRSAMHISTPIHSAELERDRQYHRRGLRVNSLHRRTSFRSSLARGDRTRRNRATVRQAGMRLPVSRGLHGAVVRCAKWGIFLSGSMARSNDMAEYSKSHVFLARGLDHIGRAKFGDKWVGDENGCLDSFQASPVEVRWS